VADYSSVFSSSGPTFKPQSSYGGYSSTFSTGPTFNPGSFSGGYDFSPSVSYSAPTATKPGFDWGAFGAASGDLLGGVSDVIRAVRGEPVYGNRMAGSRLQEYLKSKSPSGDDSLSALLKKILTKIGSGEQAGIDEISGTSAPSMTNFDPTQGFKVFGGGM
jgi:hypothetical protein